MKETGLVNSVLEAVTSSLGHMDEVIVCDAGFPIPLGVRTVDLSLAVNQPTVIEVLAVLLQHFSVEALVLAEETRQHSPTRHEAYCTMFGPEVPVTLIPHVEFKERSRRVKAVIRTGDFTAYANILLVSGAGSRWFVERL